MQGLFAAFSMYLALSSLSVHLAVSPLATSSGPDKQINHMQSSSLFFRGTVYSTGMQLRDSPVPSDVIVT